MTTETFHLSLVTSCGRAETEPPAVMAYVNVPNAPASDGEYYGCNHDRLRRLKAKYDPENVFCFEQSVPAG
jgi:Berberine and berberine like